MEWGWRLMIRLVGERAGTEVGAELLLLLLMLMVEGMRKVLLCKQLLLLLQKRRQQRLVHVGEPWIQDGLVLEVVRQLLSGLPLRERRQIRRGRGRVS